MSRKEVLDHEKFVATVLYLLRSCRQSAPGMTALIKLIWYADYWHYRRYLRTITGARYVALPNGPVLDDYKNLLDSLVPEWVEVEEIPIPGREYAKREYRPKGAPPEDMFDSGEAEILDRVVSQLGRLSGHELSRMTHNEAPWIFAWDEASPGRHIPYLLFRWADNLPDDEALESARDHLRSRPEVLEVVRQLNEG